MAYQLTINPNAKREWDKLDSTIRNQFINKLEKVLINPKVKKNLLYKQDNIPYYKIKLRTVGYRLVYGVRDNTLTITIISVGKRNRGQVYEIAKSRS